MSRPHQTPPPAVTAILRALDEDAPVDPADLETAFDAIMAGDVPSEAIATILLGLRARGESADDVGAVVRALRRAMTVVELPDPGSLVDTCGTGGGAVRTLNLSTAAAFVVAGTGVRVAKHGNRSFTSRSGSADVLEALGIATDIGPAEVPGILAAAGLVFLFAPTYHPAMRHVAPVRRQLGVPTVMNLVGPLANPAGVTRQVVGVADPSHGPLVAGALASLGTRHALVVHAEVGLDEIAPVGGNLLWDVRDGRVSTSRLSAADLGLGTDDLVGLEGGEPAQNAAAIEALLDDPREAPPALRSAVVLNAAAALMVAGQASDLAGGARLAADALDHGAARARLALLRAAAPLRTSG